MEGKIAALGDSDFVMPFAAMGLDTYAVTQDATSMTKNAEKIIGANYALVVVAENIAVLVEEAFVAQLNEPMPCIVVVPFTTESQGFGIRKLGEVLKIATGINILDGSQS